MRRIDLLYFVVRRINKVLPYTIFDVLAVTVTVTTRDRKVFLDKSQSHINTPFICHLGFIGDFAFCVQ